jgi:hypothetical protein
MHAHGSSAGRCPLRNPGNRSQLILFGAAATMGCTWAESARRTDAPVVALMRRGSHRRSPRGIAAPAFLLRRASGCSEGSGQRSCRARASGLKRRARRDSLVGSQPRSVFLGFLVPLVVRRPLRTFEADRALPLLPAVRTQSAGFERIPDVPASRVTAPDVAFDRLPAARRAPDTGKTAAELVLRLVRHVSLAPDKTDHQGQYWCDVNHARLEAPPSIIAQSGHLPRGVKPSVDSFLPERRRGVGPRRSSRREIGRGKRGQQEECRDRAER